MNARLKAFFASDVASGILLILATILAMIAANTGLSGYYHDFLNFQLGMSLLLWINDGLMAVFFLLIGLEVKREFISGELSSRSQVMLPGMAAVGGMIVPALLYVLINWGDAGALKGWAIPAATDIAFALGVLAMLGKRVPAALKVFLLALAIMDDLGAIVIIALFYTAQLSVTALLLAALTLGGLIILNRMKVTKIWVYLVVGVVLWAFVLKSGVHATLAGVVLAFTIPLEVYKDGRAHSPLRHLEHSLHAGVSFVILPIFAFANAGIGLGLADLAGALDPIPLGVIAGLFIGKQLGVFGFTWLCIKLGWSKLPTGTTWMHIYGMSLLCGIGFTMSLFVGGLAFAAIPEYLGDERIGIIFGSLLSGIMGYSVLRWFCGTKKEPAAELAS